MLPRQSRDEVERHARRERDRLVLVPDQPRQSVEEFAGGDDDLAVHGTDRPRHQLGVVELVRIGIGQAHGERADGFLDHA